MQDNFNKYPYDKFNKITKVFNYQYNHGINYF